MKLLIITQSIDEQNETLGFFVEWVRRLSRRFKSISVVCLEKGAADLPPSVSVYSLGKEEGKGRWTYLRRFFSYIIRFRGEYDAVFVHMNQEYILLGGLIWHLFRKPIYFWRNHAKGNLLTQLAIMLSKKVFYTSRASFSAHAKHAVAMPAGVDTTLFQKMPSVVRTKYALCMVGRISPVKHVFEAVKAIERLTARGVQSSLSIIGPVPERDVRYVDMIHEYIKEKGLEGVVHILPGVPHGSLPEVYTSFEICLNLTESGSFDKTIVEAASCGTIPLIVNTSLKGSLPEECFTSLGDEWIALSVEKLFEPHVYSEVVASLAPFASHHSLPTLIERLTQEMYV